MKDFMKFLEETREKEIFICQNNKVSRAQVQLNNGITLVRQQNH